MNGIATTVNALARIFGPIFCSVVFAACIHGDNQSPLVGTHLIFLLMSLGFLVVASGEWNSTPVYGVSSDTSDTDFESISSTE